MCYQKAQRLLMSSVITLGTVLVYFDMTFGFFVLGFVVVMAAIWGLVDFCPSLWALEKLGLPSCARTDSRGGLAPRATAG